MKTIVLSVALLSALAGGCAHVATPSVDAGAPAAEYVGTTEPFAANAVYFVLTDRFANGDPANDQREQGGPDPARRTFDRPTPGAEASGDNIGYLGGDFRGLLDNAGYIADMGFGAVWLTPIVDNPDEAFTGGDPIQSDAFFKDRGKTGFHGYWGVNFFELDEHLPSAGLDFAGLTAGLREHGLVTVLDIVANHGSPSFTMPVDQPKFGEIHDADGTLVADHQNLAPAELDPAGNPLHAFFHDEPDLAQLSNLDDTNPAVLDYFVRAYSQWIDQGAGAFRIDTIRHVPHPFWKAFSDRIRAQHPGFFMFGEAFDHEAANIAPHTWPENGGVSVLDFPLKAALQEVFGTADAGYETLAGALYLVDGPYTNPYELMTFYDNHDMPRMQADDAGFVDAHNWLFTARGIPVIYYGSEIGFMRGTGEHAGNRNYFGQARIDAAVGHPIREQLVRIANLRAATPALQRGLQLNVQLEGERAAFYRVLQHGGDAQIALVLLNKGDAPAAFEVERYLQAGRWRDALDGGRVEVADVGPLRATVPAHGVKVFVLDAPVRDAELAAALDIAMAGARRGD
ncbi:cyclomaltodextrin glucanotransferase [Lysobacter arseniciresistens ZS79]|uniref:Cyclomaltodextrin glucanotransferase n=1 Tax=Lysobacter arseniciresistens ZS79 TaxID=913325 RepID=A0A0A0ETF8_9GAMM|nr:alpha-amylase family glycosyl hydrolase [Lysobacter arseniciresistens]KGM53535.1 cyclomaltodextrin glucanotransferase [Lysobacter arseniciresistens ZS79]